MLAYGLFDQPEPFPNLLLGVVGVRGQEDHVLLCQLVTSLVPLVKPEQDSTLHFVFLDFEYLLVVTV